MRIIFMGTPDFSVGILKRLKKEGHEVVLVVTQPDKEKGRGKKVSFPPVKEAALEMNIPVYQPKKIKDEEAYEKLKTYNADVIVVVAFGQIIPKSILEMTKYGCINVHASILPKYRGAAPIQWAVINGDKISGVTAMQMNEGLDTGDILKIREIELAEKETGGSLFDRLSFEGEEVITETLKELPEGKITPIPQNEEEASYVGMINKKMGEIDFSKTAEELERLIRGLNPWPATYTHWNSKLLKIWDCDVIEDNDNKYTEFKSGCVCDTGKDFLYIKTGEGILSVNELQLEGKKRMDIATFLVGNRIEKGTCFE